MSYWGRLEFAAEPLANAGFHRVLRYGRGLNTTARLALKCPAVEANGSRLDLGEKHSLVIARRAARPLDRREVERGDRVIFAHGSSLRRVNSQSPITTGSRAVIAPICGSRDLTRWSILLIFQNLCLAGPGRRARRRRRSRAWRWAALAVADPLPSKARTSKRHIPDREPGLVVLTERRSPFKTSITPKD